MKLKPTSHDKDARVTPKAWPPAIGWTAGHAIGFARHLLNGARRQALARASLLLLSAPMIGLPGCLDAPPSYSKPDQVAPFIVDAHVTPELSAVVQLAAGVRQEFQVPFRSVDVGENLEANVYLDRDPGQPGNWRILQEVPASPGSFDEERPPVVFSFRSTALDEPGCHTLTFILAHASQWGFVDLESGNPIRLPLDDTKAATVTWWLDITDDSGDPPRECPGQSEPTP